MINFNVINPAESYSTYVTMYQRAKGSLKGSLKLDTFALKLRKGKRIKLPNAIFKLDKDQPVITRTNDLV